MRRLLRWVLSVSMIAIGLLHFARPEPFVAIVPSALPAPYALVVVSGVFEILGGVGLLLPRLRRSASFGLVALYVAVFPANVNMAWNDLQPEGLHVSQGLLWLRLPLQVLLIAWALWAGRDGAPRPSSPSSPSS